MKPLKGDRQIKRFLLRKGSTRDKQQMYEDNAGMLYEYKWAARLSSFFNVLHGCFKNGFPIWLVWLPYNAIAFYPFVIFRKKMKTDNPFIVINHERIHIRQQRDIHIFVTVPLLLCSIALGVRGSGWSMFHYLLEYGLFIPTAFYGLDVLRVWVCNPKKGLKWARENSCYEREAISHCTNDEYIKDRKLLSHIAYMGIKMFEGYGQKSRKHKH